MKQFDPWSALHVAMVIGCAIMGAIDKDDSRKEAESSEQASSSKRAETSTSPDEQSIRKIVAEVEEAFNQHDSQSLLQLFTEDAEIVNVHGHRAQGTEEIQQTFDELFERSPESKLTIHVGSIRQLAPGLMIEQGTSELEHSSDGALDRSHYTVIYSKDGDKWRMAYVRDFSHDDDDDDDGQINELAWLIGDWMDESRNAVVSTSYRWTENKLAIEGEFHVHASGYPDMDGTMRIAWDPQARQLRSWVFDSEGGFSSGYWSRSDDRWIVKMSGIMHDGCVTSATNILTQDGDDRLSYRSIDRTIGNNVVPDGDEIVIVRRPPHAESLGQK